jgi:PAS domain S-box-containing protein
MGELKKGMIRLSCEAAVQNKTEFKRLSDFFCPIGRDFYGLFNTIQDFIFILNHDNKIVFFNQPFLNQIEYTEAELHGKSILELFPSIKHQELQAAILELKSTGKTLVNRFPVLRKSGTSIEVETKLLMGRWAEKDTIIGICHDVSENDNYEQKIKQTNDQLEMVLLASDAGWWNWNIKEDSLTVNEKWCSMRELTPDEVAPNVHSWKSLVHPEDLPLAVKVLEKHIRNEIPFYQSEYRVKTKSGGYVWILDTGKITEFDSDGSPLRIAGINIDINAHKVNELKLQKNLHQQELLSEIALELNSLDEFEKRINKVIGKIGVHTDVSRVYIFEDANNGLVTDNTFEWCNEGILPQIEELQGVPYEMIPSWKKILAAQGKVYSENIADLPEDLRAILEPQNIKSIVVYPLYVKGSFFGFIGFDECIRYKHWTKSELELLRTFTGIISNAYERRISEKSLQESEAKNRAILESIPDILFHLSKDGHILSYRSSSAQDLAMEPEMFVNKNLHNIFPSEFSTKVSKAIEFCLLKGSYKFDYELPVNNEVNDYEARMTKMNDNEIIAIIRNVSERKRYERQLTEERDKANQANKAKSEFLANMSHEIRTPMNAILGFSEALYHKLESPQHKKILKSILSSGNVLLSLLNDILDLSKIEAGMLDLSKYPVDITNMLKEIKLLFLSKAEKKNVEINLFFSDNLPHLLMLDEIRVKQVIFNLVGNAIKFTHRGYVNITTSYIAEEESMGYLQIEVEDTGIGIPLSQQEIIFETFRQQSGQSNRLYEGAGLGLAISKRLVEKMNGKIAVKSEVGKGSVFTVQINCSVFTSHEQPVEEITEEDVNVTFEPVEILAVDDVASNLDAVESLLENSGIKVTKAENGEIALEILKYSHPALILLDIRMPIMNGYEVAAKIREDLKYNDIPIIAYTASVVGNDHDPDSGNFDGYLFKPINKISLFTELKKFIKFKKNVVHVENLTQPEASLDNLPQSLIRQLPEICAILESDLLPLWENVKDHFILFKIEEFQMKLKQTAELYNFEYLIRYAGELHEDLDMVDLESLQVTLSRFPEILEQINKLVKK